MKYLYFPGCKIPGFLPQYDTATRAVLAVLDVAVFDTELSCCGYPVRHRSFEASVYAAARILAKAVQLNSVLLTPCKCCYGNLRLAHFWMTENTALRHDINGRLQKEGLRWQEHAEVFHLLSVLRHDVGLEAIGRRVVRPLTKLKVAAHYGCHALRPADVVQFDDPLAPTLFEDLVQACGAEAVDWPLRLECCGAPLWEKNDRLSLKLMQRKLDDAVAAAADLMCTACTYCQIQFDTVRRDALSPDRQQAQLPAVLYPQLLGLALGISEDRLGLARNRIPWLAGMGY